MPKADVRTITSDHAMPAPRKTAPSVAPHLDAELLACCEEADALDARAEALTKGVGDFHDPRYSEANDLSERAYDLRERVAAMPARTPEGLQAKARIVLACLDREGLASEIAHSLARDVLGSAAA